VIIHSTRSGRFTRQGEYRKTIQYMMNPRSQVSSHRVIGMYRGQDALLVSEENIAWHAGEDNRQWLGYELCQPGPGDPYSSWQYQRAALHVLAASRRFGFPLDREHLVGHEERPQGRRDGKTDPGPMWDWGRFMEVLHGYAG
jgi:N-acetyl-anhydromuramyl-L-alanine amidase AmpD